MSKAILFVKRAVLLFKGQAVPPVEAAQASFALSNGFDPAEVAAVFKAVGFTVEPLVFMGQVVAFWLRSQADGFAMWVSFDPALTVTTGSAPCLFLGDLRCVTELDGVAGVTRFLAEAVAHQASLQQ